MNLEIKKTFGKKIQIEPSPNILALTKNLNKILILEIFSNLKRNLTKIFHIPQYIRVLNETFSIIVFIVSI